MDRQFVTDVSKELDVPFFRVVEKLQVRLPEFECISGFRC
jgi:hypothetical protein